MEKTSLTINENLNNEKREFSVLANSLIKMSIILVLSLIGFFIIMIILFILMKNMPGSVFTYVRGERPVPEWYNEQVELWGLNKPVISQFFIFLGNVISGNLGDSFVILRGYPVKELIMVTYRRTFELNLLSFAFALFLGVIFGVLAYIFRKKWYGLIPQAIKRLNWAIPIFGLGSLLLLIFALKMKILPVTGYFSPEYISVPEVTHFRLIDCILAGDSAAYWDTVKHLIMPVFCQGFIMFSFIVELTYSIIEFYKNPKKMPLLSGKIGFYLSMIMTTDLMIEITFNLLGIGILAVDAINCFGIEFAVIAGTFYRIILTFFIINLSLNFLLYITRVILHLMKKSKIEDKIIDSSEPIINSNVSNEETSEPRLDENIFLNDNVIDNKKPLTKEVFLSLRRKIFNPLTFLGIFIIFLVLILAIFAKYISPYDYDFVSGIDFSVQAYSSPSIEHIFGTTKYGRDVFSRCLFGIQTTVKVGFISLLIGMPLGVIIGSISTFFGKWVKFTIDVINGIILFVPVFLFIILMISVIGVELKNIYWILGLVVLPIATIFTQQAISYEMEKGHVKPLEFSKQNGKRILLRLPNIILAIFGVGCLIIGLVIIIFEFVNFIGFGDYNTINLGGDIINAQSHIPTAPWASLWPIFWLYVSVLGFNMLGIGLKEE